MKPRHSVEIVKMHDASRGTGERACKRLSSLERYGDEEIEVILRSRFTASVGAYDTDRAEPMRLRERGDDPGEFR